jgi:dUTP pyrophosphatase
LKRVGKFEKVSYEQFYHDIKEEFDSRFTYEEIRKMYEELELPRRANEGDSGYDFFAPFAFDLAPNEVIKIPTGIKVFIEDGWFLGCVPRSGLGFKYSASLYNTFGVIDSRYVFSDNEGHIACKLCCRNTEGKTMHVDKGQGYMQGIFLPFGITVDDQTTGIRNGGFGHSDKKSKKKNDDYIKPLPGQINFEIQ